MPASLPGDTLANNKANPSAGTPVSFDLLSGPKGSPFDVRRITGYVLGVPQYANDAANATHVSTGALSTGIGMSLIKIIDPISNALISNALNGIRKAGFTDDYIPGQSKLDATAAADSTFMYIGGGKSGPISTAVRGIPFPTSPYVAGFGIGGAGNGGSRDAGAGPAFTGFTMKMVTATGAVAPAAAIEAGWLNRTNVAMVAQQSAFGSNAAASAVVA
jgi:hypothetical protein